MARFIVGSNFTIDTQNLEVESLEFIVAVLRKFIVDTLKATIEDADVIALLPFATTIACGNTQNHIINMSVYPVSTKYHTITKHQALCGRENTFYRGFGAEPTCPGCIAKAKGVIVNNLLRQGNGNFIRVGEILQEVADSGHFVL